MIRKYFKMKFKMIEMKLVCFSYVTKFLKDKEETVDTVMRLVKCLAEVPGDALQEKFLEKLAEIVYRNTRDESV